MLLRLVRLPASLSVRVTLPCALAARLSSALARRVTLTTALTRRVTLTAALTRMLGVELLCTSRAWAPASGRAPAGALGIVLLRVAGA
jgi:hypothetical protein